MTKEDLEQFRDIVYKVFRDKFSSYIRKNIKKNKKARVLKERRMHVLFEKRDEVLRLCREVKYGARRNRIKAEKMLFNTNNYLKKHRNA